MTYHIASMQVEFDWEKLKEKIGKPKDLLKTLKSLGLPSQKGSVSNICLKKYDKKKHWS